MEIGFPGKPNITFDLPLNFANNIGFPGLIKTFLNEWDNFNLFITFGIKSNLPFETAPEVIIILVLDIKIFNNFLLNLSSSLSLKIPKFLKLNKKL